MLALALLTCLRVFVDSPVFALVLVYAVRALCVAAAGALGVLCALRGMCWLPRGLCQLAPATWKCVSQVQLWQSSHQAACGLQRTYVCRLCV